MSGFQETSENGAPIPWLGNAPPTSAKQAWSTSGDTLVVRYPFVRRDFHRLMISYYKRIWWLFAVPTVLIAAMVFSMFFFAPPHIKLSSVVGLLLLLEVPVLFAIMMPLMTWLIASATEKAMRGRVHQITLSAAGVSRRNEPVKRGEIEVVLNWANVRRIQDSQGDTLILPRSALHGVYFPVGAFADAEQAQRFRDAAIALWQKNGNMNAVPESIRAEFAPQPTAPETV